MIFLRYFLLFSFVCVETRHLNGSIPINIKKLRREELDDLKWIPYDHNVKIPENFDSRTIWPRCKSIRNIYDQGVCGWCWAVAVASVLSDRFCVSSNGTDNFEYSPVDLLSCCHDCFGIDNDNPHPDVHHRCDGGIPYCGMKHIQKKGVVSGPCKPITSEITKDQIAPKCENKCADGRTDLHRKRLKDVRLLQNDTNDYLKQIQIELMTNGPTHMSMHLSDHFQEFFEDKKNADKIYQGDNKASTGDETDHSIRLLGWGKENGTPYWLCANSWGTYWGNEGFFKIHKGTNLLNVEVQFLVPYQSLHRKPPQTATTTSQEQTTGLSCAETVTIQKSIVLCTSIVMMYL